MKFLKSLLLVLSLVSLVSCGALKGSKVSGEGISHRKALKVYSKNELSYNNVSFKTKIILELEGSSKFRLNGVLKMIKGELIFLSANFYGITVLKAKIDKEKVQLYNKKDKTYIDKPTSLLKDMFNVDFDISEAQKIFEGKAIGEFNRKSLSYTETTDIGHVFKSKQWGWSYVLGKQNGELLKQYSVSKGNEISLEYGDYVNERGFDYPRKIVLKHIESGVLKFSVTINVKSVVWNKENDTYKFKIPKNYKEIKLF